MLDYVVVLAGIVIICGPCVCWGLYALIGIYNCVFHPEKRILEERLNKYAH